MSDKENFEPNIDFQLQKTNLSSYDPNIIWGQALTFATSDCCSPGELAIKFDEWTGLHGINSLANELGPEGLADLLTEFFGAPTIRKDGALVWRREVTNKDAASELDKKETYIPLCKAEEKFFSRNGD